MQTARHQPPRQRRQARRHVNDGSAGEIEDAQLVQKSLWVPRPVCQRAVDENAEQAEEEQVTREADALRERSGNERRRDDRELQLKHREHQERNRRSEIRMGHSADTSKNELGPGITDQAVKAYAEGKAKLRYI